MSDVKRIPEYNTIKCENPTIIYNPYLIPLLQTYRCYCMKGNYHYLPENYNYENIYRDVSFKHYDIETQNDVDSCYICNMETGETYPLYLLVPCRKCNICKETSTHEWMTRAHMECATSCSVPYFITLTFSPENLPEDKSVHKEHIQDFMKRLRIHYDRKNTPHAIRYACCGEYGAQFGRPHYHITLWNLPNIYSHIEFIAVLQKLWTFGFVQCKPANAGSIGYILKYMRKDSNIPYYINVHNEKVKCNKPFFLASRNKALGLQYLHDNARYLISNPSLSVEVLDPYSGRILKTSLPHYLINKLYPMISSVIPRYVRYAFNTMCEIWKQFANTGYPLQDFRYHIIRDKLSFLPVPNPTDKINPVMVSDLARTLNECIDICMNYQLPQNFIDTYIRTLEYKEMVQYYAREHPFTYENRDALADKCEKRLIEQRKKELVADVPF